MNPRASSTQIEHTALPMPSLPGVPATSPMKSGLRMQYSRAHFYQGQWDTFGDEQ